MRIQTKHSPGDTVYWIYNTPQNKWEVATGKINYIIIAKNRLGLNNNFYRIKVINPLKVWCLDTLEVDLHHHLFSKKYNAQRSADRANKRQCNTF